jgi:hypothetical protein
MHYLYHNICDPLEDIITHGITTYPDRISFINCPPLEHSHVDVTFAIDRLGVPQDARFFGVIRHPLEKQLSLYLFRIVKGVYPIKPTPEHFRSLLVNGELEDHRYWQRQHQHTFLEYNEETIGEWWLYEDVEMHLKNLMNEYGLFEKVPMQKLNSSPGSKKDLIDVFYDSESKKQALKAFEKDMDLYERVKNNGSHN